MEDNDIIKALECCNTEYDNYQCPHCPLLYKGCKKALIQEALDLINRQKAEIEEHRKIAEKVVVLVQEVKQEYAESIAKTRAEAITEFAERLCEDRVSNDPVVIAVKTELKMMKEGVNNA